MIGVNRRCGALATAAAAGTGLHGKIATGPLRVNRRNRVRVEPPGPFEAGSDIDRSGKGHQADLDVIRVINALEQDFREQVRRIPQAADLGASH